MNSFYYFSFFGISAIGISNFVVPAQAQSLSDTIVNENYETCDVDSPSISAIATCTLKDPNLSFEAKVRYCAIQLRPRTPTMRH